MKKVNLAVPVVDLLGEEIKGADGKVMMLNEVVANAISREKAESDPIRQINTAHSIYVSEGEMELEDADFALVEKLLPTLPLIALIIAQATTIIRDAKEDKKAKK